MNGHRLTPALLPRLLVLGLSASAGLLAFSACSKPPSPNGIIGSEKGKNSDGSGTGDVDSGDSVTNSDGSITIKNSDGTTTTTDGKTTSDTMMQKIGAMGTVADAGIDALTGKLPDRGAPLPYIEYEAEEGKFQGQLLAPSRVPGDFAAESSGRKAVKLSVVGDYVAVKALKGANSIVVRLAIPDSADGKGLDSTLNVYVDGKKVKALPVTSRYSWLYGDESNPQNTPNDKPRRFFDESRLLLDNIAAGSEVRVQKDADNTAAYYVVDLIDLEQVAAPLTMPAGFLNVVDFGAVADDGKDDFDALQKALKAGTEQHKGVWIPKGHFNFTRRLDKNGLNIQLEVEAEEVRGAGMWYTNLDGGGITFACTGSGCKYYNFAINGETNDRVDVNRADNGFNDGAGHDSVLDGIWVEHTKVGFWVGKHHTQSEAGLKSVNLQIRNSRFRDLYADGVNFSNGTSNSIIENTSFRYTGDDSIAIWAQLNEGTNVDPNATGNIFRHLTVQLPWRATCFAFYGGKDTQLLNSTCADTLTYPGLFFSGEFSPHWPFEGTSRVKEVTLTRAGGPFYANQYHGAIKLFAVNGIKMQNISMENIDVVDSTFSGLHIEGSEEFANVTLKNVNIKGSLTSGIRVVASARTGKVVLDGVTISGSVTKPIDNETMVDGMLMTPGGTVFAPPVSFQAQP